MSFACGLTAGMEVGFSFVPSDLVFSCVSRDLVLVAYHVNCYAADDIVKVCAGGLWKLINFNRHDLVRTRTALNFNPPFGMICDQH